jgi:asparagine synthase (glutamine-hydrolysing)
MAHFTLTLDSNRERRAQFLAKAGKKLISLEGLEFKEAEHQDFAIVWAHAPGAPNSQHSGEHQFGLLLGYAVDETGRWIDSQAVLNIWTGKSAGDPRFGGYFAAAVHTQEQGLILGGDLVGFFPLYYAEAGGVLIAGSSPELIAMHPLIRPELDFAGLAGIFLTNGLINNQPLLRGIHRLKPGHHLHWHKDRGAREMEIFRLTATESLDTISADEARELADAELLRAIRWHRPLQTKSVLMLSGGLDSRLMAGYLCSEGITNDAICLGRQSDFEVEVGARVASSLGMVQHREAGEPTPLDYATLGFDLAKMEHLSGGFSFLEMLASANDVAAAAPMFWSGFALEDLLGGDSTVFGWDSKTRVWSFERLFKGLNAWGFTSEAIKVLLRTPDAGEVVEGKISEIRREFERGEETPWQRCARTKLLTRARFHIGHLVHRLAMKSWPLLPILDRRLLERQFMIPDTFKAERRLQKNMLAHRFPKLMRIPREHSSFKLEPLNVSRLNKFIASMQSKVRRNYWHWRGEDPRRYFRYHDTNGPLWAALRIKAEPHREKLNQWLNPKAIAEVLPGPAAVIPPVKTIAAGTRPRLLLGLMLWSGRQ